MDQDKDGKISNADFHATVKENVLTSYDCTLFDNKDPIFAGDQVSAYAGSLWHLSSFKVKH